MYEDEAMNLETVQDLRARHEMAWANMLEADADYAEQRDFALSQAAELLACAQGWQEYANAMRGERDAAYERAALEARKPWPECCGNATSGSFDEPPECCGKFEPRDGTPAEIAEAILALSQTGETP